MPAIATVMVNNTLNLVRDIHGKMRRGPERLNLFDRRGKFVEVLVNLREESLQYIDKSKNRKTDNLPQQGIGETREESLETCQGCPLFDDKTCYSQFGTPSMGFESARKAKGRGKDKSIEYALAHRHSSANYLRMGSIGDPGSIAPDVYLRHDALARKSGLKGVLSYTHQWHWLHAKFLKGKAIASCDTWRDVVDAIKDGWRTAWHVDEDAKAFNGKSIKEAPQGVVDGKRYVFCPAQRKEFLGTHMNVHCNNCGLCDGEKKSKVDVVVFAEHGSSMNQQKSKAKRLAREAGTTVTLEWE